MRCMFRIGHIFYGLRRETLFSGNFSRFEKGGFYESGA
jgi:hypothetical protein